MTKKLSKSCWLTDWWILKSKCNTCKKSLTIRYLDEHVKELAVKIDTINAISGRVHGVPIQQLIHKVENLEEKTTKISGLEWGDNLTSSVAQIKERVEGIDNSQKGFVHVVGTFWRRQENTCLMVSAEMTDLGTRLNLTTRAVGNHAPTWGSMQFYKGKMSEPKPFCGGSRCQNPKEFYLLPQTILSSNKYGARGSQSHARHNT